MSADFQVKRSYMVDLGSTRHKIIVGCFDFFGKPVVLLAILLVDFFYSKTIKYKYIQRRRVD